MITALALLLSLPCVAPTLDLHGGDKVLHAGATASITLAGYGVASALDAPLWGRLVAGAGAGAVAGLAKETLDWMGFGSPSLGDLVFDGLGVGAGIGIALAFDAVSPVAED